MRAAVLLAVPVALLCAGRAAAQPFPAVPPVPGLEAVPPGEAARIENTVRLTLEQMGKRYPGETPVARGVHPKDHGCVRATFRVLAGLPDDLRVGVFAQPGREYQAYVRYSDASVRIRPDTNPDRGTHDSRGMAVKLLGVCGDRLVPRDEPLTQDFLMVNHPVFAFANVEDYEALSQVLLADDDRPDRFFAERIKLKDGRPDLTDPVSARAAASGLIVRRIASPTFDGTPAGAFQPPPAGPDEATYFSGAPYLFGPGRAMKYSVRPVAPASGAKPNTADPNYLRTALTARLSGPAARPIEVDFLVQVRTAAALAGKLETEVENACTLWPDEFRPVARITIPPQEFNTPAARALCEGLFFTPWHAVKEHQPLGGINRLKLGVYEASSRFRHLPKEPAGY